MTGASELIAIHRVRPQQKQYHSDRRSLCLKVRCQDLDTVRIDVRLTKSTLKAQFVHVAAATPFARRRVVKSSLANTQEMGPKERLKIIENFERGNRRSAIC